MADKQPTFEQALAKLEAITQDIEEGKVGLEESIRKYEEGMKLIERCRKILSHAEQRIQELQKTPAGGLEAKPMPDADERSS